MDWELHQDWQGLLRFSRQVGIASCACLLCFGGAPSLERLFFFLDPTVDKFTVAF